MGIEKAILNELDLEGVIGNYSISDLRQLGILQPMLYNDPNRPENIPESKDPKNPNVITGVNLKNISPEHLKALSQEDVSDTEWEAYLRSGRMSQEKLQQILDSIKIYEEGRR